MTMSERIPTTHTSQSHSEMLGSSASPASTPSLPPTSTPYHSDVRDRNPYNSQLQPTTPEEDGNYSVFSSDSSTSNSDPDFASSKIFRKRLARRKDMGIVTGKGTVTRARGLLAAPNTNVAQVSSCEGSFVDVSLSEGSEENGNATSLKRLSSKGFPDPSSSLVGSQNRFAQGNWPLSNGGGVPVNVAHVEQLFASGASGGSLNTAQSGRNGNEFRTTADVHGKNEASSTRFPPQVSAPSTPRAPGVVYRSNYHFSPGHSRAASFQSSVSRVRAPPKHLGERKFIDLAAARSPLGDHTQRLTDSGIAAQENRTVPRIFQKPDPIKGREPEQTSGSRNPLAGAKYSTELQTSSSTLRERPIKPPPQQTILNASSKPTQPDSSLSNATTPSKNPPHEANLSLSLHSPTTSRQTSFLPPSTRQTSPLPPSHQPTTPTPTAPPSLFAHSTDTTLLNTPHHPSISFPPSPTPANPLPSPSHPPAPSPTSAPPTTTCTHAPKKPSPATQNAKPES
ncbi:hypothetical protein GLAREA_00025 [Glarea lozoyensis ATCC 20868]|uniref:Uncharacterized protein n=1 Tax=Glarea lozoyensis (strain ATCC 20868 / MF5171) TaxID=1116229 RepID=S3CR01_GLAL2|nr:uncharacterized protein GLAREA_00025 [Glarea lozoyensis ATCC 20868]EPE28867.1 hypothetical protein GLAREA_00025 [Glarea lozoyensis ATCC 20868]